MNGERLIANGECGTGLEYEMVAIGSQAEMLTR